MKRGRSTTTPTRIERARMDGLFPIPGVEHAYITRAGAVYSDHPKNRWRGKLRRLGEFDNGRGYFRVRCGGKTRCIHIMVAATFIGPRPAGLEVNHIDGDKRNNAVENLENAKVTVEKAASIRSEYLSLAVNGRLPYGEAKRISLKYGVSEDYPRRIALGQTWNTR